MARRKTIAEARDNLARLIHEVEDGEPVEITRREDRVERYLGGVNATGVLRRWLVRKIDGDKKPITGIDRNPEPAVQLCATKLTVVTISIEFGS